VPTFCSVSIPTEPVVAVVAHTLGKVLEVRVGAVRDGAWLTARLGNGCLHV